MSTYAIGDVQGCLNELQKLLDAIHFDSQRDTLWFAGDMINRGSQSLETLRFIKNLGERHITILGNHDLHLLAVHYGARHLNKTDTLDAILNASDKIDLIEWLRHRPLLHSSQGFTLVHAGLAPAWSIQKARALAHEVETALRGQTPDYFLKHMYGNEPDYWDDNLAGMDRLRVITNYLTRLRFCYADGRIDLKYKGEIAGKPKELLPWFDVPNRANENENIIFGHWAALNGKTTLPCLFALDTGCVWGNCLTALRLEDKQKFSVACH